MQRDFQKQPYIIAHVTQKGKSFREKKVVFLDSGDKHFGGGIQILNPEPLEEEEPIEIDDEYYEYYDFYQY